VRPGVSQKMCRDGTLWFRSKVQSQGVRPVDWVSGRDAGTGTGRDGTSCFIERNPENLVPGQFLTAADGRRVQDSGLGRDSLIHRENPGNLMRPLDAGTGTGLFGFDVQSPKSDRRDRNCGGRDGTRCFTGKSPEKLTLTPAWSDLAGAHLPKRTGDGGRWDGTRFVGCRQGRLAAAGTPFLPGTGHQCRDGTYRSSAGPGFVTSIWSVSARSR
jgi:hypothetical protein